MLSSKMELKKLIIFLAGLYIASTVASVEIPKELKVEEPKKSLNTTESPTISGLNVIDSTTESTTMITTPTSTTKMDAPTMTSKKESEKIKGKSKNLIEKAIRKVFEDDRKRKDIHIQKNVAGDILEVNLEEINQAGDMAHEIDPARTGLLLSVVLSFFFVYIFVITKYGNRNPRYVRFEAAGNVASIGEPFEMKPQ